MFRMTRVTNQYNIMFFLLKHFQADACHAYRILRNHGMPAERIVLMMYDDIAKHTK